MSPRILRGEQRTVWTVAVAMLVLASGSGSASAQDADPRTEPPSIQELGDRARERTRERLSEPDRSRLRLFLDDAALSPTLAPRLAFSAALDQRSQDPVEWGRGAGDFGRRLAARAGRNAAQAGVHHGVAALMRLEPRDTSRSCKCGHPLRRTAHAFARTFATRDARGRLVPNVPLVAGAYGGAMLAAAWYPPSYRTDRDALRVASFTLLGEAGANVFREFSPELKRLLPGR